MDLYESGILQDFLALGGEELYKTMPTSFISDEFYTLDEKTRNNKELREDFVKTKIKEWNAR